MSGWTRVADVDEGASGDTTKQAVLDNESCVVDLYSNINSLKKNFASTAAPSSPAPDEGQLFYNTAKDTLQAYDGSAWDQVKSIYDVSGVRMQTTAATETLMRTVTIPANLLAINSIMRGRALFYINGSNGAKSFTFYNGVTLGLTLSIGNIAGFLQVDFWILVSAATTIQFYAGISSLMAGANSTQDITAAFDFSLKAQCANASDTIQMIGYVLDICN